MKEITSAKRLEVAYYYLLGCTFAEIEAEMGVSHGSIANIIKELKNGDLTIPETPSDQVVSLRQLAVDLKKANQKPSQALLGFLFYKRTQSLGIFPDQLDRWSDLAKILKPTDFPAEDFLEAALRLHELEKDQGKSFETLTEDYEILKDSADKLNSEVESLTMTKEELTKEVESIHSELVSLKNNKTKIENDIEIQNTRLKEMKSRLNETKEEKAQISKKIKGLHAKKNKLLSEIDGREELLERLNNIGFSHEDILRISTFIEATNKSEGIIGNKLKKRFFLTLRLYQDVAGLENKRESETERIKQLVEQQSILKGEIAELEEKKGFLGGGINTIMSISESLKTTGEDAARQIQQQVSDIKNQFNGLLLDAVKAGEAIGRMRNTIKDAEMSENNLTEFIGEVESTFGGN